MQSVLDGTNTNPDISLTQTIIGDDTTGMYNPLSTTTHSVSYAYSMTLFGISVTKYEVSVRYKVSGSKITSILDKDGYVVHNYNPEVQTSLGSVSAWISNNDAFAEARFTYGIGPFQGLSVQLGNCFLEVEGNYKGHVVDTAYWEES
ncbi:hypothetical protein [Alicyclobacillus shizuokensis]|uniref:hypothetical protein n=1 Tax=Alicyclobacillus shizuokensis TaxID=392014 RepID=UPI0012EDD927|nr:hypothetical protein [Alicyclobacillus shizuokensis]